ncbi:hypothetical protein FO519_008942 [Halicephalobus sp. NKZ332]|nr:hypothetical protein FO519_008942 [Halicephalobus sp. NKZ332]
MFLLLVFSLFLSSAIGICPDGSTTVPDGFGSKWKCLQVAALEQPFFAAENYCDTTYQGYLISIPNGFVNFLVAQTTASLNQNSSRFWIGVSDLSNGEWKNIDDGSNTTYFDWAPGEPSNSTGSTGCVSVDIKGLWHNDDCFTSYSFVCEVPEVGVTPTTPSTETTTKAGTTTSANYPLASCWSYIPFAVDASGSLTPNQFSAMKNFIATHFLKELFPIDLQPAAIAEYTANFGSPFDVQFNVSDMVTLVGKLPQYPDGPSDFYLGIITLTNIGVFDYKDGIPMNFVVFAGNTSDPKYACALQRDIDLLTTNGSTVTIIFVNPDLDLTPLQNFTNVNIVQWSDNSTELLTNIRKNMRCGGGEPVYYPCKRWFSFFPDYSNTLSETDFNTQRTFIKNEVGRMNRPDKIQLISDHGDDWVDWNNGDNIEEIQNDIGDNSVRSGTFSLNTTLQTLSNAYYSQDRTEYQPPYTALVFIPTTASYENYGGAEEVAQNLTNAGFQLAFFLMGPDVDETKLTNYTTNFIYWRDMSNPQPDNWDEVRLQAYGCQND